MRASAGRRGEGIRGGGGEGGGVVKGFEVGEEVDVEGVEKGFVVVDELEEEVSWMVVLLRVREFGALG